MAAYEALAVLKAMLDGVFVDRDGDVVLLPAFPVAGIFFVGWKRLHMYRWWLVGEWTW
jgi:hypothetical protein